MTTNAAVVDAWMNNRPCNSQNLSTDGFNLHSYALQIGYTCKRKFVLNYMSPNNISNHVALAKSACDVIVPVKE